MYFILRNKTGNCFSKLKKIDREIKIWKNVDLILREPRKNNLVPKNLLDFKVFFSESELRKSKSYVSCEISSDNSRGKNTIKGFKNFVKLLLYSLKS